MRDQPVGDEPIRWLSLTERDGLDQHPMHAVAWTYIGCLPGHLGVLSQPVMTAIIDELPQDMEYHDREQGQRLGIDARKPIGVVPTLTIRHPVIHE